MPIQTKKSWILVKICSEQKLSLSISHKILCDILNTSLRLLRVNCNFNSIKVSFSWWKSFNYIFMHSTTTCCYYLSIFFSPSSDENVSLMASAFTYFQFSLRKILRNGLPLLLFFWLWDTRNSFFFFWLLWRFYAGLHEKPAYSSLIH